MYKNLYLLLSFLLLFNLTAFAQNRQADVIENALSAVVTVAVYDTDIAKKTLGFRGGASTDIAYAKMLDLNGASGSGSGFVIDKGGKKYVITNSHVIDQASDKDGSIAVYSISRKMYNTRLVGGDTFYDIAVLEFIDAPGQEITTITFREAEARVGEQVFAIGNPLGEYPYSVSEGIISAKNRTRGGLTGKFGFLQSTATVIWGNSGGPLIDKDGKVIGINSQIAFAENGGQTFWQSQINFALEANLSSRLVNDIILNNGLVKRSFLGIEVGKNKMGVTRDNPAFWDAYSKLRGENHPVIAGVMKGSPAERALSDKIGYCIAAINGNDTRNIEEVLGELENVKPGSKITFSIHKGSMKQEVTFTTAPLNYNRSTDMALYLAAKNGWSLQQDNNSVIVNFTPALSGAPVKHQYLNPFNPDEKDNLITTGQWIVVGAGYLEDSYDGLWRINEIADISTATRLTAMSGMVDLFLVRKGSDTNDSRNYLRKRVFFADDPALIKETLLY
jgi:S1-C subfamily serine protease